MIDKRRYGSVQDFDSSPIREQGRLRICAVSSEYSLFAYINNKVEEGSDKILDPGFIQASMSKIQGLFKTSPTVFKDLMI